jgi:AraC family transcriptional activator of tynA and feaB
MKEAVGGVQMEAINTRPESPNRSRLAAWAAQYGAQFDRSDILTNDLARFDAQMRVGKLGALRFAQMACRGSAVDRVLTGDPGEAPLGYNHAPHRHHIDEGSSLLLLRVPARALRSHLPSPEQFCGRRLAASSGMTIVATSLARNLCGQANANLPAAVQECLSRQLLETVSLAFSLAFGQLIASSSVVGGRYARARLFIEQNLGDPELGPHSIACALNVSARYLRMIFAREGECISSYVLRRRLEETARQLADPRWRGRSICEIAFTWGFNSAPHFSRSFREHFGIPPREYRARQATTQQDGQAQPDTLAAIG